MDAKNAHLSGEADSNLKHAINVKTEEITVVSCYFKTNFFGRVSIEIKCRKIVYEF